MFAIFQYYINGILNYILEHYLSIYSDNIYIYFSGSEFNHWSKKTRILNRLIIKGFNLNFDKNAFAVKKLNI